MSFQYQPLTKFRPPAEAVTRVWLRKATTTTNDIVDSCIFEAENNYCIFRHIIDNIFQNDAR